MILIDYLNFNNFKNVIDLYRTDNAMTIHLQGCNFYNSLSDILNTNGLDHEVISMYNLLSTGAVTLHECNFLEHSYINITSNTINGYNNNIHYFVNNIMFYFVFVVK